MISNAILLISSMSFIVEKNKINIILPSKELNILKLQKVYLHANLVKLEPKHLKMPI